MDTTHSRNKEDICVRNTLIHIQKDNLIMTGIDKLVFKAPYIRDAETVEGIPLQHLIRFANSNGLGHGFFRLPNENRQAVSFRDTNSDISYEGLFVTYTGRDFKFVNELFVNPSHFPTYSDMTDVLNRIAGSWLWRSGISRIDLCVDYDSIPFSDLISGLDIAHRTNSQIWIDCRSGLPTTLYFGAGKDKIMVYDKSNELSYRNRAAPPHRCRVERQLRTPGKIADAFGQPMMATNLQDQLLRIVNGTVCPFTAVNLGTIRLDPSRHHGADRTLLRLGELRGMTQIASFANARRYIHSSQHRNFRRYNHCYERNELPVQQQPDAVLRRHLSDFMQVVPLPVRRRCRVAIPLTASDDAA